MTFDAVPPGQQETSISPTANGVGRSKRYPRLQPSVGITVYCSSTPGSTRPRSRPTRRKSSKPSVIPMLSMMTPSPIVIRGPLNQVNSVGRMTARIPAASTQSGNADVKTERMRKTGRIV